MLKTIDSILNRVTMYRLLIYCLCLLLAIGFVFALTDQISISAGGLVINLAILFVAGYISNNLLARMLRVANNFDAGPITCLILACILPTSSGISQGIYVALAAIIAMASKYVLVWRRSPIFNPAAVAAVVLSITGLLPATWWIGSPPMAAFTAIVALVLLRKQRKFSLFAAFALASLAMFLLVNYLSGDQTAWPAFKLLILSYPLIFMGSVMLTEPSTLPIGRNNQVLYGLLVGSLFTSQLHAGSVSSTPEVALIIGNILALAITPRLAAAVKLKRQVSLGNSISNLYFEKPPQLNFLPGQYLEWTLSHKKIDSRGNRRSFSIASSPTEAELQIGIKNYEPSSSFKLALAKLKPGQTIQLARPSGTFTLPADLNQPLIFIAGGIGITPFRSMIKYLIDTKQQRQITLFYSATKQDEFVYRDIFDQAKSLGLTTNYMVGRVDQELIDQAIEAFNKPLIYISGPNAMVQAYRTNLRRAGIPNRQIRTDYFSGY